MQDQTSLKDEDRATFMVVQPERTSFTASLRTLEILGFFEYAMYITWGRWPIVPRH